MERKSHGIDMAEHFPSRKVASAIVTTWEQVLCCPPDRDHVQFGRLRMSQNYVRENINN